MASVIKLKRSLTPGAVPSNLNEGEIAVNLEDLKLYVGGKNGAANVQILSGDLYNLVSRANTSFATNGADIILTVDNQTLSNDAISLIGDDVLTIAKSGSNSSITFSIDNDVLQQLQADSGTATGSTHKITIAGTAKEVSTSASGSTVTIGLPDDVSITSDLTVGGGIRATGNLHVTTYSTFGNTVAVTGAVTMAETLGVSGNTALSDRLDVTGNTALTGTLTVTGATALNGGLSMDSTKFTVADTTGNVRTEGKLDVVGKSTVAALHANGNIDTDGSLTVDQNALVSGKLDVSKSVIVTKNLTVSGNTAVSGNMHVDGNLSVEGAVTYISSSTVNVDDSMLKLSANNAGDTVDTGVYGMYVEAGPSIKYAGYFRDASDNGIFKFYANTTTEPTSTVDTNNVNYRLAQVDAIIDGGQY